MYRSGMTDYRQTEQIILQTRFGYARPGPRRRLLPPIISEEPGKTGGGATLSTDTDMELSGPRPLIDDLRARLSDARRFL